MRGSIFDTLVFLVIFTAATVGLEAKGALCEELLKVNSIDLLPLGAVSYTHLTLPTKA